jgi:hypothetical protein
MCLSTLSYHEAWEMSYFGASVLHPRTTMPAMKYDIPITIRNFFNKDIPGTIVALIIFGRETPISRFSRALLALLSCLSFEKWIWNEIWFLSI